MHYRVANISEYWFKGDEIIALFTNGERANFGFHCLEQINYSHFSAIPAEPRTFYMGFEGESGKIQNVWFKPVIAWMVGHGEPPLPVTTDGVKDGVVNDYAVIHPTGRISRWEHMDVTGLRTLLTDLGIAEQAIDLAMDEFRNAGGILR